MATLGSLTAIIVIVLGTLTASSPIPEAAVYGVSPQQVPNTHTPQYAYAYDVHDPYSGVFTSKTETRDGDVVHGSYSVDDADGFRRVVQYSADPVRGFNADVSRQRGAIVPQVSYAVPTIPAVPVSLPVTLPVVQTYVASPPAPAPSTPAHQLVYGSPVAVPLATVAAPPVWRTFAPGLELARYRTSLTSPTHSYSY